MWNFHYFLTFCIIFTIIQTLPNYLVSSDSNNVQNSNWNVSNSDTNPNLINGEVPPTVLISVLVRNKAHTLPYFLNLLENLDYPKERIAIWIRSDHNEDSTPQILRQWGRRVDAKGKYHSVSIEIIDSPPYRHSDEQKSPITWTTKRFRHVIRLKEEALRIAKRIWADYIWFLDADVFIVNNQTLRHLVAKKKDLVAPMLISGGLYSNFWCGMKGYYYVRTDQYAEILHRKPNVGCFQVPMIHSAVLMNLRNSKVLDFKRRNDSVPEDDIIILATNAQALQIPMEICNDIEYGAILAPLEEGVDLSRDEEQLRNLRAEIAAYWPTPLVPAEDLKKWAQVNPIPTTIGFDKVYLINLKRRPDRLIKMLNVLEILGIDSDVIEATDGRMLTTEKLNELGITQLPSYRDPHSKRVMTYGEIGCFLSHYRVWEDMLGNRINTALILEDDIRFEPYFVYHLTNVLEEAGKINLNWDLLYLGRKRSVNEHEPFVPNSKSIVEVGYTYWTLGYGITNRGARKLLAAEPFKKLVPLDEFLPLMYDRHINSEWAEAFPIRNLKAYSAEPLLLFPTHYTGEPGYVSDTEYSEIITGSHPRSDKGKNCSTMSPAPKTQRDEL